MDFILNAQDKSQIINDLMKISDAFKNASFGASDYIIGIKEGKISELSMTDSINVDDRYIKAVIKVEIREKDTITSLGVCKITSSYKTIDFNDRASLYDFLDKNSFWDVAISLICNWDSHANHFQYAVQRNNMIYKKLYQFHV